MVVLSLFLNPFFSVYQADENALECCTLQAGPLQESGFKSKNLKLLFNLLFFFPLF